MVSGESAGRHPCSAAWRDAQGLRPAVVHLNFELLKLKTLKNQTQAWCAANRPRRGGTCSAGPLRLGGKTSVHARALSVRQHLPHRSQVGLVHQRKLFQLAHPPRPLGPQQMPFPGVHADDFTGSGHLKALCRPAMRLQFLLRFRCVSRHG
jgi:hypothetical protein